MSSPLALALLAALLPAAPAPDALEPAAASAPATASTPSEPRRTSPEILALVRLCVEAYGGNGGLARASVRREEGRVTSALHPGDVGRIQRAFQRPGKLRVVVAFPGADPEIRVLDGGRGWRDGTEVKGPRLDAMTLQAARLDLPALLSVPGTSIEDRGKGEVEGTTVRVLAIEPAPGLTVEAHVDVASGRILKSRGSTGGKLTPIAFETTYGDFRKIDGVLVAFHEENWANGKTTGETVIDKVEFLRELPAGTFAP
jgi:hypothetical protein